MIKSPSKNSTSGTTTPRSPKDTPKSPKKLLSEVFGKGSALSWVREALSPKSPGSPSIPLPPLSPKSPNPFDTFKTPPSSPNGLKTPPKSPSFRLEDLVTSPTTYKSLTSLPRKEFFEKLDQTLSPRIAHEIKACFDEIYSPVTQRNKPVKFFYTVPPTVFFENQTHQYIKGKDHGKKAASILGHIDKTLEKIRESISSSNTNMAQKELLETCADILKIHANGYIQALKGIKQEVKEHIKKHQHLDVDTLELHVISLERKEKVRECYPSPQIGQQKPPSEVTVQDYKTMRLVAPLERLRRLYPHHSSPDSPSVVVPRKLKYGDETSSDSDEDFETETASKEGIRCPTPQRQKHSLLPIPTKASLSPLGLDSDLLTGMGSLGISRGFTPGFRGMPTLNLEDPDPIVSPSKQNDTHWEDGYSEEEEDLSQSSDSDSDSDNDNKRKSKFW